MGGGFRRPLSSAARRRQDTKPPFQRRPQAARHQTPVARAASCRLARALGRGRGRGAFGPPSGGRNQPKENHGRAPDRGPPPSRRRAAGGAPAGGGRVRRRRGTDAGKAANPTPRRPQPAAGPPPPRQSAPAGGLRPPAPRRPATRPDAGRPRAGGPAASHQPTPTAARAHGPGPDKAGPLRLGRGRPGRASTGPACTRPAAYISWPSPPPLGAGGDNRHGGGPGRRALCARNSGRAEGPRGGRIRSRGHPSRSWGGVGGKKNAGGLAPPAGHDWTKKKCGEDALSPPLAVTADTRFPPVRRSSPTRTRCRPVPYALAVRPPLGLRSCVP